MVWKFASRTPVGGQVVEVGGVDIRSEAAELGVADVVEHHQHHVWRAGWPRWRLGPPRPGLAPGAADNAPEIRCRHNWKYGRP